ncbi:HAD domain-containing protein [Kitasatospora sp. NPDC006697]|uniref:HAD domain-containing protein n=1 Tax=Kitasatospora sp. NPDC006697 TaxID=3364020 RepID=UPI0036C9D9CA
METPLLFLDVDGPLLPFGGPATRSPTAPAGGNPLLGRLDPAVGPRLAGLGCELVWATTWGEEANLAIAPLLGLPPLPVLPWPEPSAVDDLDARAGRHWKTRPIVARAAGRPFIWVDDEITRADLGWIADHHPAPALPHRVDPAVGLTEADFELLARWVAALSG